MKVFKVWIEIEGHSGEALDTRKAATFDSYQQALEFAEKLDSAGKLADPMFAAAPKLLKYCTRLLTWIECIRDQDENLVIESGYDDGFNLNTVRCLLETLTKEEAS